jgi:hypothetical protein
MKRIAGVLALFALLLQAGSAFAQSSDYEIIESFKAKHHSLLESIKNAQDIGQREQLESDIGRLEADYGQHQRLLAEGLYPGTFETALAALREQLNKSTERILLAEESRRDKVTIVEKTRITEEQGRKIVDLTAQNEEYRASLEKMTLEVQDLSARIQKLSDENTGLLATIKTLQQESKKDKESIARLKALTEKLQANIRDRDELIVKMMDSLFDEYSKADLTDAQRKNLLAIAQQNDYVSKIVTTIDGNINYVGAAVLTPQDVKVLREQQKRLGDKWEGIKPFVGKLYPDEQSRARDITTVDGRLTDLRKGTSEAIWRSLQQVFSANGVVVSPFRNGSEFHASLIAYLDGQLKDPSRAQHRLFRSKVWDTPIKDQWLPVIPTDQLSEKQVADIEERIALWDKKIAALLWRWVLIGVCGLVVVVAAVVVIRKRSKKSVTV